MVKRGGYTGDRIHAVKFYATPKLYEALKRICESKQSAMALVLRELVTAGLEHKHKVESGNLSRA